MTATLISLREAEAPGEIINEMWNERDQKRKEMGIVCYSVFCLVCWSVLKIAYPIRM